MVIIDSGFYFCHSFDIGTRLDFFENYEKRESITDVPNALRYQKLRHDSLTLWISELGLLIAFQKLEIANFTLAHLEYQNNFEYYYSDIIREIASIFHKNIEADTSFLLHVGFNELKIDWKMVRIPHNDLACRIMLEAVLIDELCRTIDKRSRSFINEANLPEERLIVQYVENLFPLAIPASFLVAKLELEQMDQYFFTWRLGERVAAIRARFSESVTNTSLYRGHLERHRQSAMNSLLSAITVLSLAQVSDAISDVLMAFSLHIKKDDLNKIFAIIAMTFFAWGSIGHLLRPAVSLWIDDAKRKLISWRILKKNITN